MKELTPEIMSEAVLMIEQMRSGTLSDTQLSAIWDRLHDLLPDPDFMKYIIDVVPEMSPEEVVKKTFQYCPILLGPAKGDILRLP